MSRGHGEEAAMTEGPSPLEALMQKLSCACANMRDLRAVVLSAEKSALGGAFR